MLMTKLYVASDMYEPARAWPAISFYGLNLLIAGACLNIYFFLNTVVPVVAE